VRGEGNGGDGRVAELSRSMQGRRTGYLCLKGVRRAIASRLNDRLRAADSGWSSAITP